MSDHAADLILSNQTLQRPPGRGGGVTAAILRWTARSLATLTWISGALFAIYILGFFGGSALRGAAERWNERLPGLHDLATPAATVAIGAHFLAGAILLLFGPIQLIGSLRRRWPVAHRFMGRAYVVSALLAGLGGLGFIAFAGTIGGPVMDIGFGLYGALMVLCAAMAIHHARHRRIDLHRAWAIRLFALTIGSWLYRMEYAGWTLATGGLGRGPEFSGWFDAVMAFFFFIPNLMVAEVFIRSQRTERGAVANLAVSSVLLLAFAFVLAATVLFALNAWIPNALSGITGEPVPPRGPR